ncbi:helix-turn-helix domain-containing protein [Pseudoalteromonas sp. SMS1]|uniref:HTH cro/C1-type domain-containing protein n=1 Tax=Pseudoalteromonas luteoviolacea DSM 6061 TaxID=1365250 RepID=A0A166VUS5_9GAMM|nr:MULTISPECIES: helix-turn-helix transcriptional regulator [Pseudoalteromonas]KZN33808.1 hypothetical protein N475_19755 [Pseudoalteromonas luteoviolacea DSM 6061]KZN55050.1 hypothetical protein N474_16395 [Pseudoalteromonas luteoviolacea CPMOR-2]MBE0389245.1 hypothetical protein [Pseudoalteromonas luteoviolacea DSM 6061]MCF2857730.1 helix-turn-helix domain-containing protein [Pseudoalteromonas sp. SMS1]TQF68036.1 helix-turn-helix transcriptional regulator [Pseudoalteromonas luteoviolacea]
MNKIVRQHDEQNLSDLKVMRLAANKTQKEMAKVLGTSEATIINYENGVSDIKYKDYLKWSLACRFDLSAIEEQLQTLRTIVIENNLHRYRKVNKLKHQK